MSKNKYTEVEGIDATTYAGKAALAAKKKARGTLGDELVIFTLVQFIQFIQLNNKFMDLGIHITDDNKVDFIFENISLILSYLHPCIALRKLCKMYLVEKSLHCISFLFVFWTSSKSFV